MDMQLLVGRVVESDMDENHPENGWQGVENTVGVKHLRVKLDTHQDAWRVFRRMVAEYVGGVGIEVGETPGEIVAGLYEAYYGGFYKQPPESRQRGGFDELIPGFGLENDRAWYETCSGDVTVEVKRCTVAFTANTGRYSYFRSATFFAALEEVLSPAAGSSSR